MIWRSISLRLLGMMKRTFNFLIISSQHGSVVLVALHCLHVKCGITTSLLCQNFLVLQIPSKAGIIKFNLNSQRLTQTYNFIEGTFWMRFQSYIYSLIGIREENVRINAICVKLDGGQEVPLYSRREYQESNQRLLTVLQRYNQMNTESFLRATSRFIKYRGVDPVQEEVEDNEEME